MGGCHGTLWSERTTLGAQSWRKVAFKIGLVVFLLVQRKFTIQQSLECLWNQPCSTGESAGPVAAGVLRTYFRVFSQWKNTICFQLSAQELPLLDFFFLKSEKTTFPLYKWQAEAQAVTSTVQLKLELSVSLPYWVQHIQNIQILIKCCLCIENWEIAISQPIHSPENNLCR